MSPEDFDDSHPTVTPVVPTVVTPLPLDAAVAETGPEVLSNEEYTRRLIEGSTALRRGIHHPAHTLLDQIETASSFPSAECGQKIRELVKKVRATL